MSKRKSKLRQMAEAGDPWAIETLAKAQAEGRAAALHGAATQRARARGLEPAKRYDPAFAEAMRDAADIREWTDGPKASTWRIYRLAQALCGRA